MNPGINTKRLVTVFCGSSSRVAEHYLDAARHVARILSEAGLGIVYGGGSVGLMGALADEILLLGGDIRGVIPSFMVEREWVNEKVLKMDVVTSMSQRKDLMLDLGDMVMALPGGLGTLDEFFEALTLKQLGRLRKPLVLFNPGAYFDPLIRFLQHMQAEHFLDESGAKIWHVLTDEDELRHFVARWLNEMVKNNEVSDESS